MKRCVTRTRMHTKRLCSFLYFCSSKKNVFFGNWNFMTILSFVVTAVTLILAMLTLATYFEAMYSPELAITQQQTTTTTTTQQETTNPLQTIQRPSLVCFFRDSRSSHLLHFTLYSNSLDWPTWIFFHFRVRRLAKRLHFTSIQFLLGLMLSEYYSDFVLNVEAC